MASKLEEIRRKVEGIRKGLPLEFEGLTLFVIQPTVGLANKWDAGEVDIYELMRNCVMTEDKEFLYKDATDEEMDAVPSNVVKAVSEKIQEMTNEESQEVVAGN